MDRRVARSRRLLRDALVELVLERGWEATGVRDVCERADVGRSTFYTHFGDKEALLISGLDELRAELRASPASARPLGFLRPLLDHTDQHRPLFRALVGHRSHAVVQGRFRGLLRELVAEDLPAADATTVDFVAGGLFAVLSAQVDRRVPPDQLLAGMEPLLAPFAADPALTSRSSPSGSRSSRGSR